MYRPDAPSGHFCVDSGPEPEIGGAWGVWRCVAVPWGEHPDDGFARGLLRVGDVAFRIADDQGRTDIYQQLVTTLN